MLQLVIEYGSDASRLNALPVLEQTVAYSGNRLIIMIRNTNNFAVIYQLKRAISCLVREAYNLKNEIFECMVSKRRRCVTWRDGMNALFFFYGPALIYLKKVQYTRRTEFFLYDFRGESNLRYFIA